MEEGTSSTPTKRAKNFHGTIVENTQPVPLDTLWCQVLSVLLLYLHSKKIISKEIDFDSEYLSKSISVESLIFNPLKSG